MNLMLFKTKSIYAIQPIHIIIARLRNNTLLIFTKNHFIFFKYFPPCHNVNWTM